MRIASLPFLLSIALVATNLTRAEAARNVLLLISDNQNWNDLGCYGNPVVKTPNIDALAERSVTFQNAFATTASCGASRAVILTGLLTHANGQYGHPHSFHNFQLMPRVRTIFQFMEEADYRTGFIGKTHVKPDEKYPADFAPKISGWNVTNLAKAAGEFFRAGEDPFFMVVGNHDPHPTSRDRIGWGIKREFPGVEPVAYDPADVIVPSYLPDTPVVRENLAGYYQQISRLDQGVGSILQELESSGKTDETLILFFSDHGSSEPGAMGTHYEPGVHVPFLLCDPRRNEGSTSDALITLADVVPTVLDWTGAEGPDYQLHGRSLMPILDTPHPEGWDEVLLSHVCHEVTMYYPMRTIRTPRYKLIWNLVHHAKYPLPIDTLQRATWLDARRSGKGMIGPRTIEQFLFRDELELYDLQDDPNEIHNLADDPEYAELRDRLSERLLERLKETEDPWLVRHQLPTGKVESTSAESE